MKKQQSGFTLIELVLVIVILGILAATALPRFSNLTVQARVAAVNGLAGSMRSASVIAHTTSLVQSLGAAVSVTLEGQTVTMVNFYPTADAAGIGATLTDTTGFNPVGTAPISYQKTGATTVATCAVSYAAAAANGSPTITASTAGC